MDKGAHFYKCDFQVHTPRDINWSGERPTTEEGRKAYADEFVKACREKGLDAIAITDHHDFAFFPFIKDAANTELDDEGQPIPNEQKLIVFPGLELTLSTPPCQAIMLIDTDYPIGSLSQILHLLAIEPSDKDESTTAQTTPITNTIVNGFEELCSKLDSIESLKGKFIILPNLNEGGRHTLLRAGNAEQFRKMPCVGGYVDRDTSQHGTGNQNIVNGKAMEWGYKSVAVFQTSDSRNRDFSELGLCTTWVKWALPTAEALRQACLAKESRISLTTPELPSIFITKIDVTNSKFLGSFSCELNQQYTALIGGRGTGKSTILEYLRWGLCDQTYPTFDPDEHTEIEKRRQSLIEKTLVSFNGEVRITFNLNGIEHIVKRDSTTKETLLKISDGDFELVKGDEIRRILPIQAYSQKQLSSVGVRTEELKRFIQQPISNQLNNLKFQLSDNAKKARNSYNSLIRKREIQNEVDQLTLETKSLNNQVESLRKSLTGISEEYQQTIAQKQKFDLEQNLISKAQSELSLVASKIEDLIVSLKKYPEPFPKDIEIANQDLLRSIDEQRAKFFNELNDLAAQLQSSLSGTNAAELNDLIKQWSELREAFDIKYESAKEKASSNQQQLDEIHRIETRLQELSNTLNDRDAVLKEMGNPIDEVNQLREEWYALHQDKVNLLQEQSQTFSELSKGLIKAEVTKSIDIKQIKKHLVSSLSGTRIRDDKIQSLFDLILAADNPLEVWKSVLAELRQLAELKISEDKKVEVPETPVLTEAGFNEGNKTKIVEIFTPEYWLTMATTEIEFEPTFKYTTNNEMGDDIPFSEASAGQQATALLTVLLNQPGTPLLIDQPEDDIDNRAIDEIISNIWNAKKKRQLVFTSHNANLVVNGDSELVVCCDYREAGNQTRGTIKAEGAIDSQVVKDEITSVMEGGEKAFRLRKDKYGF
ncbi:MAG: AAA family ATPase [Thermodesulfobacteriota bacterium]|nr:AAA family ATPase [Thermodesulfobacteriota bacterium]